MDKSRHARGATALDATFDAANAGGPSARRIAGGQNWSIREFVCTAGPGDRPFEERHDTVSIAIVVEGSFIYSSETGRALLHPGALLLGNHGACFQCGHDHSTGDRCISLQVDPEYFAEIAASAAGSSKFRFPVAMLPARRSMLPHTVMLESISRAHDPLSLEENLTSFMTSAIHGLSGVGPSPASITALDERRVSRALRHIEAYSDDALDLDRLAGVAAMSKFHFLRVFRRTVGMTPYQYVLGVRLRAAALRLLSSQGHISAIALESGFGDLSTFNTVFRNHFGMNPTTFRKGKAVGRRFGRSPRLC